MTIVMCDRGNERGLQSHPPHRDPLMAIVMEGMKGASRATHLTGILYIMAILMEGMKAASRTTHITGIL